uniref:Uncharacterized protein n=1 Tax=Anguilla anguilla TaxID=7936 RepID=A0A0E9WM60_ANGAN
MNHFKRIAVVDRGCVQFILKAQTTFQAISVPSHHLNRTF